MNFIFDLDDTIYDRSVPFSRALKKLENDRLLQQDVYEMYESFYYHSDQYFKGLVPHTDELFFYRFKKMAEDFNEQVSMGEAEKFQEYYDFFRTQLEVVPEVLEVFEFLKNRDISIRLITNGYAAEQRKKIECLSLNHWISDEDIIISDEVDLAKPDLRIFQYAEEVWGLDPRTTVYIGDHYENDIVSALRADWTAIWVSRYEPFTVKERQIVCSYDDLLKAIKTKTVLFSSL